MTFLCSIRWKEWSGQRFIFYWGSFLQRADATADPQYSMIKDLYFRVVNAGSPNQNTQQQQTAAAPASTNPKSSSSKQGKSSKKTKSKTTTTTTSTVSADGTSSL